MFFSPELVYALSSVLIISAFSLLGVVTLAIADKLLRKVLLFLVSFSAGSLLGTAFFHLLPEAVEQTGFTMIVSYALITGVLSFFILEKFLHWHHSHVPHGKGHTHDDECVETFAYTNLIGDGFHNLIDGIIIAGSYLVSIPLGITTTIAVGLHEIPQEIGDFAVLLHAGFSKSKALLMNLLSALTALLGALLVFIIGVHVNLTFLLPFTAGGFIYIAAADLLPELQKEKKPVRSLIQFISMLLGIGIAILLLILE